MFKMLISVAREAKNTDFLIHSENIVIQENYEACNGDITANCTTPDSCRRVCRRMIIIDGHPVSCKKRMLRGLDEAVWCSPSTRKGVDRDESQRS